MYKLSLAAALLIAAPGIAQAQNEVEWKQTLSMPKGAHMPRDRADILGIEIGDTYEEAKAKLLALWNEGSQDKATPPRGGAVKEQKSVFRLDSPGSQAVTTASFVKRLEMERLSKGAVPGRAIHDKVQVYLSSPASGHQVIAVVRNLFYQNEQDQPRVSEILDHMSRKMKGQPHVRLIGSSADYTYQFDQGNLVLQKEAGESVCFPKHESGNAEEIRRMNPKGDCDAMMRMTVEFGISRDHARSITFILSDLERTKANSAADFAFVQSYVRSMQERTRGTAPKL